MRWRMRKEAADRLGSTNLDRGIMALRSLDACRSPGMGSLGTFTRTKVNSKILSETIN